MIICFKQLFIWNKIHLPLYLQELIS